MKSTCFCSMNRSLSVICPLSKSKTADCVQMTHKSWRLARTDVLWVENDKLSEICVKEVLRAILSR